MIPFQALSPCTASTSIRSENGASTQHSHAGLVRRASLSSAILSLYSKHASQGIARRPKFRMGKARLRSARDAAEHRHQTTKRNQENRAHSPTVAEKERLNVLGGKSMSHIVAQKKTCEESPTIRVSPEDRVA